MPKFKFMDRVMVTNPLYCCAYVGECGYLVDDGSLQKDGTYRYLVRWDHSPTTLFGVSESDIRSS